jgi:threonine dehydratase
VIKDETKQVSGAFNYRGIRYRLASAASGRGMVTASTGNHAAGLAMAARGKMRDLDAFVPATTPAAKLRRIDRHGARLHLIEGGYDDCERLARAYAARHGLDYIHAFDDPQVIAGHQSLFSEIGRVAALPDMAFVPVGGGGLVSAAITAWGRLGTRVIGVEHCCAPAMAQSLRAGRPVSAQVLTGAAEGLLIKRVGDYPFAVCSDYGLAVETVDDSEIEAAVRFLYVEAGIRAEFAGAAALAAALRYHAPGKRALCVISGGNIDDQRWERCLT